MLMCFLFFFVVVAVDIFMKYIGARIVKVVWDIFGTLGLQWHMYKSL